MAELRNFRCPECGIVSSVSEWCERPICVHGFDSSAPEIWDGNDTDGLGSAIELAPNEDYRIPGPDTWTEMMMLENLFISGEFVLSSGQETDFKIECDALGIKDWEAAAAQLAKILPKFDQVEGVPRGGLKLASALREHSRVDGGLLIVDDVLTTGASLEKLRAGRVASGAVLFARGECPEWITPLFRMTI